MPEASTFASWRLQAPKDFRYAVKANHYLTQAKNLKDWEEPQKRMMELFRHLRLRWPDLNP
ncbi:DUF72 domain-containing protein [Sphingomonas sp. PB4P5]|uniref:DUF72 domain-containing protein n=1 Tax=Parasphingomonas puruogangriensis TaxID=3096155 RepID=UPI002FCBDC58